MKISVPVLLSTLMLFCACNNKGKPAEDKIDTAKKVNAVKPNTHLEGVWFDEEIKTDKGEQIAYEIVTRGEQTFIQVVAFKGKKLNVPDSPDLSPDATELKKQGEKFVSKQNANERYEIDKSGDLLIYDESGLVVRCKKLL
ncbi:hypothetical protein MUY27_11900 [Mucilaginibacter sp. RS28]|uniref:Lipoprotein n=1 Tax=Mucilaginibacter straminoryzae TaxID=2932774 RepID=A0A9X1X3R5_9SPHI|nr:hypothetical protein [Mucilaginibacter straminoryzae]MCJ8210413.1 hypothetical protein [Mucilaginibacter straminoryzae]